MASAQTRVANVGGTAGGTDVSASEKLPRPVQLSRPTKTNAPIPEASRPGSATRLSVIPLTPATSMIKNAPSTGEPSSVLIAAKLPADVIISAIGGASFFARLTVSAARPPPIAISGASPEHGAEAQCGQRCEGDAWELACSGRASAGLKAKCGRMPPLPGRYRMTKAVNRPHNTNQGTGHHAGAPLPKS